MVAMQNTPTISVKGVGRVSAPPDLTVVTFTISALDKDYDRSAATLNARVVALRSRLDKAGIKGADLKTTQFGIEAEREYKNNQHVFVGWKSTHELRLELPVDRELLNKAVVAFASGDVESEITIAFEVKDREAMRERILDQATRTARRNAEAIATAAGCRLGKVLHIEYGWAEVRFRSMDYSVKSRMMVAAEDAMLAPEIEPENVRGEDSVTMVWELVG
jgi:uncharacterized protein YggE